MKEFKETLKKHKLYPELPKYEDLQTHLFFSKEKPSIQDLYNLCIEIHNRALDLAIENAEVKWVDNPKMSDKNHQTAIVDVESIEKLKIQ